MKIVPVVFFVAAAIGLALAEPGLLHKVVDLGHNIPQSNVAGDYLFALFWAALFWLSILLWPVPSQHKQVLFWLWAGRCLVTLGFMLLVENYYEVMDGFTYFDLSREGGLEWHGFESMAGTENIINLARLHRMIVPVDSYHAMKVSFGMIGLVAVYVVYRAAVMFLGRENLRLLCVLSLWPSILFWSSLLGKDPIVLLGVALYVYGAVGWHRLKNWHYLVPMGLGIVVAMLIRVWMGPILLAPLAIFAFLSIRGPFLKMGFTAIAVWTLWLAIGQFQSQFNIQTHEDALRTLNLLSQAAGGQGGSGQEVGVDLTDIVQTARFLPWGVFTALFRPLPGEVQNAFGWLAGIEDLALLWLVALAFMRTRWRELREPVVLWAVSLVLVWAVAYASISYLNLGMGHRYRLQIMPILLCVILYLSRRRRKKMPTERRYPLDVVRAGQVGAVVGQRI